MVAVVSSIERVVLYHRGATVLRRVALRAETEDGVLPPWLEIVGLPLSLRDASVRIRIEGANIEASNIHVELFVAPREEVEPSDDEARLVVVERELELQRDLLNQVSGEIEMLGAMAMLPRPEPEAGKPPPPSPMAARLALEEFLFQAMEERQAEIQALTQEIRNLEDERADLKDRLQRASEAETVHIREVTKKVKVQLTGKVSEDDAVMWVEYFVLGARWAPAYRCRLSHQNRSTHIEQRALVVQRSGEDWLGVKLSLSTADALSWTELPELSSVRIGRAQAPPPAKRGFIAPPVGANQLFSDYDREAPRGSAPGRPGGASSGRWVAESVTPPMLRIQPAPSSGAGPGSWAAPVPQAPGGAPKPYPAMAPAPEPRAMSVGGVDALSEVLMDGGEVDEELTPVSLTQEVAAKEFAAAPMRRRSKPAKKGMSKKAAPMDAPTEPGPLGGEAIPLSFADLELAEASELTSRGRLRPLERPARYLESLEAMGLKVVPALVSQVLREESSGDAVARMSLPSDAQDVRKEAGYFDFVYETEAPVDVPSDGIFHSIPVQTRTAESHIRYVVVPRLDPQVFRQVTITNPLDAPLLSGPAEIYVDDTYVLTTRLPTVAPQGLVELGLGVEDGIRCARNTTFSEKRSGTQVVATRELVHEVIIELVNRLDRAVQCEVRERIPQPAPDAEVVVHEREVAPSWEPYDQEERGALVRGGRRWRLSVPARGQASLKAQYVIEIYANNEVLGGNRREV